MLFLHTPFVMKHRGSLSQTYITRNEKVIPDLYRRAKALTEYPTTRSRLLEIAVSLPVDRFYIADDAAMFYIRNRIYNNIRQTFKTPYKQRLFDALYDEVKRMLELERYRNMSLASVIVIALSRPAPCIGLSPDALYLLYRKHCRHRRKEKTVP